LPGAILTVSTSLGRLTETETTTKDEQRGLDKDDAEENVPAASELCPIEPGRLREVFLANLRRRGVRLGEPVGGARIEQLHELLSEGEDWMPDFLATRPSLTGMLTPGDVGESLSRRLSQSDPAELVPISAVAGDEMSVSDFQSMREQVQAAEAGLTLLRPSFTASKRDSRASHRNSVVASLRASPNGSQRASLNASPRRSRNASLVPSLAASKVTSRRNSSLHGMSPSLTASTAPNAGKSQRLNSSDTSATTPCAENAKAATEGTERACLDGTGPLSFALPEIKEGSPSPVASDGGHSNRSSSAGRQRAKTITNDTKLREALEKASPNAKLKDLLLVHSDIGDLCLDKFLDLVSGSASSSAKDRVCRDEDEVQSASDSEFGDDEEDEEETAEEESAEGEGWQGSPEHTLLSLDPNLLQHVMKMLIMLNDGLQTRHCNCKPGGPHTCMSPVASLLVSQVQSLHHSLCNSVGQSVVQTVQPSRRGSGSGDRKELTPLAGKAPRKQRNSGGSDAVAAVAAVAAGAASSGSSAAAAAASGAAERRSRRRTGSIGASTSAATAAMAEKVSSPVPVLAPRTPTSSSAADAGAGPSS